MSDNAQEMTLERIQQLRERADRGSWEKQRSIHHEDLAALCALAERALRAADPAPTRNSEVLEDFRRFCEANPSLRFWQALKAWCGSGVYLSNTAEPIDLPSGFIDPFYREEK